MIVYLWACIQHSFFPFFPCANTLQCLCDVRSFRTKRFAIFRELSKAYKRDLITVLEAILTDGPLTVANSVRNYSVCMGV